VADARRAFTRHIVSRTLRAPRKLRLRDLLVLLRLFRAAGQGLGRLAGGSELGLADIAHVEGVYTLAATTRNRAAHVLATRLTAGKPEAEIIRGQADLIALLSKADPLEAGPGVKKPAVSASTVVRSHEIFLPLEGLIDVGNERKRLERELDKVMRDFESSMRKLQNEDFLGKARKDVVERERTRLESLGMTKEKLERNLEVLR
jgi:valyl-tRNA synthetase